MNVTIASSITRERHVFPSDDGVRNVSVGIGRSRPLISTRMHRVPVLNDGSNVRRMATMRSLRNELEGN